MYNFYFNMIVKYTMESLKWLCLQKYFLENIEKSAFLFAFLFSIFFIETK